MSEPKFEKFIPNGKEYRYARGQERTAYFFLSKPETFASINLHFEPREAFLLERIQIETDLPSLKGIGVEIRSMGYGSLLYDLAGPTLEEGQNGYLLSEPAFFQQSDTVGVSIKSETPIVGEIQVHLFGTIAKERPRKLSPVT